MKAVFYDKDREEMSRILHRIAGCAEAVAEELESERPDSVNLTENSGALHSLISLYMYKTHEDYAREDEDEGECECECKCDEYVSSVATN